MTARANYRFDVGYYSHVGSRNLNEDDFFHLAFSVGKKPVRLAGVADGMGGNHAGEAASQAAVQSAMSYLVQTLTGGKALSAALLKAGVRAAMSHANRAVCDLPGDHNQGTTLTLGVFTEEFAVIGHVGDTRCYLCTPAGARQLTEDHAEESGALTKRLGRWDEVEADVEVYDLVGDAIYAFCSDGVHGNVTVEMFAHIFESTPDPKQGCVRLVEAALNNAGPHSDNLTCLAVEAGQMPRNVTQSSMKAKRVRKVPSQAGAQTVARGRTKSDPASPASRRESWSQKRFMLISGVVIVLLCGLLGVVLMERFWPGSLSFVGSASQKAASAVPDVPGEEGTGLSGLMLGAIGLGALSICCLVYLLMPSKDG